MLRQSTRARESTMATSKKTSEITARSRVPDLREQALALARRALRDLKDDDVAEVMLEEFDRRGISIDRSELAHRLAATRARRRGLSDRRG